MKFLKVAILGLGMLLSACASYDMQQAMRPDNRNIYPKLPNMEPIFEAGKASNADSGTPATTSVQLNNEFATYFRREVEKNLIDEYGPIKGKLVLEPIFVKRDYNMAWRFPNILIVPMLLGCPMTSYTTEWELELNVLDKSGQRIKRYSAEVENTEYEALYWGYKDGIEALRAATFEGYKKALNNLIQQLQADIPSLSAKLK
ncbi:MAG: hypothetical protein II942_04555 [Alphaproteobacteria bacterium]|nr:hypothetical protein [Alphaproteobacteria bacterium]